MVNHCLKVLMVLTLVGTFCGCGLHARVYSQDRARVDQELPPGSPTEGRKLTRKVYFLEVIKDTPQEKEKKKQLAAQVKEVNVKSGIDETVSAEETQPQQPAQQNFTWTSTPSTSLKSSSKVSELSVPNIHLPAKYTIEKDDTLQSIAKKFYNSYGKWPQIYNANKDKISDPNHIKTGTVITVPKL